MYYRVKIKKLPNKAFGGAKTGQQTADGALAIQPTAMGGADIDQYIGEKPISIKKTLQPEPREASNVEVEKGEVVVGDLNGDGMLETYVAGGKRHSQGGTPLNLPDDTFIFSDTASMRIKDPDILAKFGKTTGSYTPATLAKQYDINKYRAILQDNNSDAIDKKTAELMIRNYTMKLGGLAAAQESMKGFPQNIAAISKPFFQANGISEENVMPTYQPMLAQREEEPEMTDNAQEEVSYDESMPSAQNYAQMQPEEIPMGAYGMELGGYGMPFYPTYAQGGLVKAQKGSSVYSMLSEDERNLVDTKWNKDVKAYLKFREIADAINSDPDFQDELFNKYNEIINDNTSYTAGESGKQNWYGALKGRSKADVVNALLAQEERNARLEAYGLDPKTTDQGTFANNTNKQAYQLIQNTPGLQDLDFSRGHISQAAYAAYDDIVGGNKRKQKSVQVGKSDEPVRGDISGIDNNNTNTTLGQRIYSIPKKKKPVTTAEEKKPGERPSLDTDIIKPQSMATGYPEWTTPDVINFYGAIKDKNRINKYYPYAPGVDLEEPDYIYLDPTTELAKQSEDARMLTNSLAQFVGPKGLSSRASGIQGTSAQSAADTLSRYNQANVTGKNQQSGIVSQIRNQERALNAEIAKKLYDETSYMNQQYDNAMTASDQNIRKGFATGWQNASAIALANELSQQYDIDPKTGRPVFTGGKDLQPDLAKTFNAYVDEYIQKGFDPKDAIQAAKIAMGETGGYPGIDALLNNKKGGSIYVMGDTIFPFMFY